MMPLILYTYRFDALNTMRNGDFMEAKERRVVGMAVEVACGEWWSGGVAEWRSKSEKSCRVIQTTPSDLSRPRYCPYSNTSHWGRLLHINIRYGDTPVCAIAIFQSLTPAFEI